jgi:hypothetical protein
MDLAYHQYLLVKEEAHRIDVRCSGAKATTAVTKRERERKREIFMVSSAKVISGDPFCDGINMWMQYR